MGFRTGGYWDGTDDDESLTTFPLPHQDDDEVCGTCCHWDSSTGYCPFDPERHGGTMTELVSDSFCYFDHWHHKWKQGELHSSPLFYK